MVIDVVIPTYKPDERLLKTIDMLFKQSISVNRVVLMNTEEKYLDRLFRGRKFIDNYKRISVKHVSAWEYDHGKTRNKGADGSTADFILFMTQDAIPEDDKLIENLVKPFEDPMVASAYARQIPSEDATLAEAFSREFNYPEESGVKSQADLERLGIKTYFCSNACAMYRREVYEKFGRFPAHMIFNEDMVFAHTVISNGYKIAYAAQARVIHSHNYTNRQQYKRNFDLAVSQAMHPEVFGNVSSESEGLRYAKAAFVYFKDHKKAYLFIPFAFTCFYRLCGYRKGKKYEKMTHRQILKCTMSPKYFKKMWS